MTEGPDPTVAVDTFRCESCGVTVKVPRLITVNIDTGERKPNLHPYLLLHPVTLDAKHRLVDGPVS